MSPSEVDYYSEVTHSYYKTPEARAKGESAAQPGKAVAAYESPLKSSGKTISGKVTSEAAWNAVGPGKAGVPLTQENLAKYSGGKNLVLQGGQIYEVTYSEVPAAAPGPPKENVNVGAFLSQGKPPSMEAARPYGTVTGLQPEPKYEMAPKDTYGPALTAEQIRTREIERAKLMQPLSPGEGILSRPYAPTYYDAQYGLASAPAEFMHGFSHGLTTGGGIVPEKADLSHMSIRYEIEKGAERFMMNPVGSTGVVVGAVSQAVLMADVAGVVGGKLAPEAAAAARAAGTKYKVTYWGGD